MDFSNQTTRTELSFLAGPLVENFSIKFSPYGIHAFDRTNDPAGTAMVSSLTQTILRCEALETDSSPVIRLRLETGDDRRMLVKDVPYNLQEPLDQNLTIIGVKILHAMEESVLSRVQVISNPSIASLTLDGRIQNETPWESYLSNGRHLLKFSLAGYEPLETSIAIAPGNNRFSFTLVPVKTSETAVIEGNRLMRNSSYRIPLVLTFAFAALGGISHSLYLRTNDEYGRMVSSDKNEYDNLNDKAENYLKLRNASAGGFAISGIVLALKLMRRAKQSIY
ncbi:MAG: PEGA domain-containing protein [Fibrobacterota bacterium]